MASVTSFFTTLFSNLSKYARTIGISDIADIIIVTFLIYKVLRLMWRSNTGRVIKAVILILIVIALSSLLRLNVLNFIFGRVFEMGLLALVIVFQPELRRLLEQVGSSSLSSVFKSTAEKQDQLEASIRQTVAAAEELSRQREGALIIFERRINLDDILKTGTIVEAETSSELLRNIFYPKAPLHDGAVIIRDSRIAGAGCMLPLSGNANLSRDLGMRHRAGIGISEQSDAVSVIVSEETGAISVAVGGMLKRRLTPETLERLLLNELKEDTGDVTSSASLLVKRFRVKKNDKKDV